VVDENPIEIREETAASLETYADVTIAFTVGSVLTVTEVADGFSLEERPLDRPWVKNYDALESEGPTRWSESFDVTNWLILAAYRDDRRVGGAVVAADTPAVDMLEGRSDLAVLWDLRVAPTERGRGVGRMLFEAAESWARERGCVELKVETQDINVGACRFYERMGFALAEASRGVYPECPGETQLIWRKKLG
jgi:GNAT superfamily N-acetyltransferase